MLFLQVACTLLMMLFFMCLLHDLMYHVPCACYPGNSFPRQNFKNVFLKLATLVKKINISFFSLLVA